MWCGGKHNGSVGDSLIHNHYLCSVTVQFPPLVFLVRVLHIGLFLDTQGLEQALVGSQGRSRV